MFWFEFFFTFLFSFTQTLSDFSNTWIFNCWHNSDKFYKTANTHRNLPRTVWTICRNPRSGTHRVLSGQLLSWPLCHCTVENEQFIKHLKCVNLKDLFRERRWFQKDFQFTSVLLCLFFLPYFNLAVMSKYVIQDLLSLKIIKKL